MKDKDKIRVILQNQYATLSKLNLGADEMFKQLARIRSEAEKHNIPMTRITLGERSYHWAVEHGQIK